jgi:phosphohistidine phosphatase
MTRELLLLRHGKSDWNTGLPDFERPLKERGRRGAQQLGNWLLEQDLLPDLILSSGAERARGTALEVCHTMGLALARLQWEPRIYAAGLKQLLAVLRGQSAGPARVLLVGHNPGLELLLRHLAGPTLEMPLDGKLLPTATLARLKMPDNWDSLTAGCAQLETLQRPAHLPATFPFPVAEAIERRERPAYYYDQSAVIPYRRFKGKLEILVIRSRGGRRWVLPKGIREPELSHAESAVKEAWEEAGARGRVGAKPLGEYRYAKWGADCRVQVYPLAVEELADEWEESFREREWLRPKAAAKLLQPEALGKLVRKLGRRLKKNPAGLQ